MNCFVVGTDAENFIVNFVCFVELFSIFVAFCKEQQRVDIVPVTISSFTFLFNKRKCFLKRLNGVGIASANKQRVAILQISVFRPAVR